MYFFFGCVCVCANLANPKWTEGRKERAAQNRIGERKKERVEGHAQEGYEEKHEGFALCAVRIYAFSSTQTSGFQLGDLDRFSLC